MPRPAETEFTREKRQWITKTHLKHARAHATQAAALLQSDVLGDLIAIDLLIERGDFEPAMDALAALYRRLNCRAGGWRLLEKAASNIGLADRASSYHRAFLESVANSHSA
ncbi:hypothetical protein [Chitinimonas sp.]|uniref:hypothetical protein n=1 Tax=Chitinimonas sp. TaxID=1934313 RepID=UPI0035B0D0F8